MRRREELRAQLKHPTSLLPDDAAFARTALALAVLVPTLALVSVVVIVLGLLRAPRRWLDACYTGFARFSSWVGGTSVHVDGLEHVDPRTAYVVIVNHESDWDPIVLFDALRALPMRAVIKREMIRIPVLGAALRASGNVCVDRDDSARDAATVTRVMEERPPDVSIVFYAEGTRSRDGAFHDFKKGPFVTAIRYGMPILPVATAGTYRIWPPLTVQVKKGPATVEIGEPISTTGLTHDDRDTLRDRCHGVVAQLRTDARSRLRQLGVEPGGID